MTYHLAAFRLHSIGERSARFTDVTLDFTAPHAVVKGPADTVVWLRNGGGKSSLLSLFYALVLPKAIDFMGRSVKRSLTDYVDSGDTAHTIAMWHPAVSQTLDGEPDRVLVTGAVYEWSDLRRPADADRARERLDTTYYAFYTVPGVLDLDRLPILDETCVPKRRTAYIAAIREVSATYPQATDLVVTDRQHQWTAALTNRGLDPSLFRTQKQMNHVEGGVEDLFKFSSAREFIDLLIDLTIAPDDAINVAERLSSIASLLATKPAKTAERDFCLDAAASLEQVTVNQLEADDSAVKLGEVTEDAADLAAAFAATVAAAQAEIVDLDMQRSAIEARRTAAATEQATAYDFVYLYEERASEMRVAAADAQLTAAKADISCAADLAAAWQAAEHLTSKADLQDALERNRRESTEERERAAPQRHEHDEHAARLHARLLALAAQRDEAATAARAAVTAAENRLGEHREDAKAARQEVKTADRDAADADARLESLAADLRAAVGERVLLTVDDDPAVCDATLANQQVNLVEKITEARARRAGRPKIRTELSGRLTALAGEQIRLDGDRTRVATEFTTLSERAAALAELARVRDLTEATYAVPVDLWAEADTLTRRLSDAILEADLALVRLEAERLDDQRTLDVHARTGLLPTTLDAERIQAVLAEYRINAETGWSHLRTLIPDVRLVDTLTDPDLARLGVGLVIPSEQADAAATALTAVDATTTGLVGVYTAEAASAITHASPAHLNGIGPMWTGLHRGLVNATAAETAVRQVTVRADAHQAKHTKLTASREADRALLGGLAAFLDDCSAGHLDSLIRRTDDLDLALADIATALHQINTALADLDEADTADSALEQQAQDEVARIGNARVRLAGLIEKVEAAAKWREDLAKAEARSARANDMAEWCTDQANLELGTASKQNGLAETEKRAADVYRIEVAGLTFLDTEPGVADNAAVSLDGLRACYRGAEQAWQGQAAQSVLAERERALTEALGKETKALATVSGKIEHHAVALLRTGDGQTSDTRATALAAARQAEKDAIGRDARAASDISQHTATLAKIRRRRADPPRRHLPVDPRSPEHADTLAIEQDRVGQGCIERRGKAERELGDVDKQQDRLRNRVSTFELLADGLPEPTGRTTAPFAGDNTEAHARKRAVAEKVRAAEHRANVAATARTAAVANLRMIGGMYPTVATPAKDRVLRDSEDVLAQHSEALAIQLRLRAVMIDGELAGIAKDQAIIAGSLARLVSSTLDTLRKAERYSRVDTQTGGWSGRRMLRIAFEAPASDADLHTYINRVIERRIADGVKVEGRPLLKDALHEAVGPRGFTIKVLKPTLDMVATTEDITRLGKWSGGEKLTVCVALYCTIAALRAVNNGRKDRSGGVLLLDNPIGRASHGSLVRLQRAVAAAHKVQLVYTTGVKDPDAVSRFPNVIRLDNRPGRTRHRRYIVPDTTSSSQGDQRVVTGVRVAHDEPATLDTDETDTEAIV